MQAAEQFARMQAWRAPVIEGGTPHGRSARDRPPDEAALALADARRQAEEAGRAAGLAAAREEIAAKVAALDAQAALLERTMQALSRPLAQLDEEVHGQIARLATGIARALLRRELKADPAQVIGMVRDTVDLLPASTRGIRVLLHPQDAALLRERLASPQATENWTIAEDPMLSRGDCRVVAEYAEVDARLETRLNAALAQLLGDERQAARGEAT